MATSHRAPGSGRIGDNCISGGSGLAAAAPVRASKHRKQDPPPTIEGWSSRLLLGEGFLLYYWTQKNNNFCGCFDDTIFSLRSLARPPPSCTAPGFLGCENFC